MVAVIKGQVISGGFGNILVRQKSGQEIELGELLIADTKQGKILMQVIDLTYGSQLSQSSLELISGLRLEQDEDFDFMDRELRNYTLARLKSLLTITPKSEKVCKSLPDFFSEIKEIQSEDLKFLTKPKNPLYIGELRSGSKALDVSVFLEGDKVFCHHILIPGTTGRGKSVLVSNILWNTLDYDYCGILVLDPHDEYYGRNAVGLKDHKNTSKVIYYTPRNVPPGCRTLKISIGNILPQHFDGVVYWTDAQKEALNAYFKKYREKWIEAIVLDLEVEGFMEGTLAVLKRRMLQILDLNVSNREVICNGIFDLVAGKTTIADIAKELEESKVVIIDTSNFSGEVEILIGSIIATAVLDKYKYYKVTGKIKDKPVVSIVIEEAPRVLGKETLDKGPNIFSAIAREGRKFKVGLVAITQLPSLIPRQILSNINTKIILGIEMQPERQAIIDSAAQDLSEDNRNIASLDKGEAIITSNFSRFAIPVKIPLFAELAGKKEGLKAEKAEMDFSGVKIE